MICVSNLEMIKEAAIELKNREDILNNLAPGSHSDIVTAAELEITAQRMRINGLIAEYKEALK